MFGFPDNEQPIGDLQGNSTGREPPGQGSGQEAEGGSGLRPSTYKWYRAQGDTPPNRWCVPRLANRVALLARGPQQPRQPALPIPGIESPKTDAHATGVPGQFLPTASLVGSKLQACCKPVVSSFEASSSFLPSIPSPAPTPARHSSQPRPGTAPRSACAIIIESGTDAEVTQIRRVVSIRRPQKKSPE